MAELFENTHLKSLELDNRSVRSATWSGVCDLRGYVTDRAVEFYSRLASGGIGLIVTGFQYVMPNAIAIIYQMGNYRDDQINGLSRLAQAVHAHGGKLVGQLVHTGAKADPELFPEKGQIWGPSAVADPLTGNIPREMTLAEIEMVIEAYAAAAARCRKAGFDGVQLHGAHGYGINQFLSGASNRRTDSYGGDIGNRYRFLGEVLGAVRSAVGQDFPVLIKLSGHDYFDGGLTTEESLYVARKLVEEGIDAIEVSAGSRASQDEMVPSRTKIRTEKDEAYLVDLARRFKQAVNVPIITVGGIRSPGVIAGILSEGAADYVAMCRPFIREPHLINRWKNGDPTRAKCISCSGCFDTGREGDGVSCKVERDALAKQQARDPGTARP